MFGEFYPRKNGISIDSPHSRIRGRNSFELDWREATAGPDGGPDALKSGVEVSIALSTYSFLGSRGTGGGTRSRALLATCHKPGFIEVP